MPGLDLQLSINADGRLLDEEAFGDIIVRTGANGAVTRLRDVARLERAGEAMTAFVITQAIVEKFGGDAMVDVRTALSAYNERVEKDW